MSNINKENISKATVKRLPSYLTILKEMYLGKRENVSATVMAANFNLNPVQVRKDLASISSIEGKPKKGFCIVRLIEDIENFLGYDNAFGAILVGVGQLGKALLSYKGFMSYGLEIAAAFDNDPMLNQVMVHGKIVHDISVMPGLIRRLNIKIGIITVPKENAQRVAEMMVESGIKAIWNFAPTHLVLPDNIAIKNEDMASSLAILSQRLTVILKKGN